MGLGDNNLVDRDPDYRTARKTITFDGTAGHGLVGAGNMVVWFTVTGLVGIDYIIGHCTIILRSTLDNGTLTLGYVGNTAGICAASIVTAVSFTAPCFWGFNVAPSVSGAGPLTTALRLMTIANVVSVVATNDIISGVMTMIAKWKPLSDGASLVPGP